MTKAEVLNHWADALGGRSKLKSLDSMYFSGSFAVGGLQGIAQEWVAMDGRRRCEVNLHNGLYSESTVFDGRRGWRCSLGNPPVELMGSDLHAEINAAFGATYSVLLPDRMPSTIEFLGEDSEGKFWVIRAAPERGSTITWYLDKTTFLPARFEEPDGARIRVTFLDDWQTVEGLTHPHLIRESTGQPEYDSILSITDLRLNPSLGEIAFDRLPAPKQDWAFAAGATCSEVPFELSNNHIYLQARLKGLPKPIWFLLDSGAAATVVDPSVAKALGTGSAGSLEGRGAGSESVSTGLLGGVTLQLPDLSLRDRTVAVQAKRNLSTHVGRRIDGILGYDVFSRFVVEVDYASQLVVFHQADEFVYKGSGVVLPLLIRNGHPHVRARITMPDREPLEGLFTVDTGSSNGLIIHEPFAQRTNVLTRSTKSISSLIGFGTGGRIMGQVFRVDGLQLGSLNVEKPVARVPLNSRGYFALADVDGNIGGEILRRFRVIFDYTRMRMILEPAANFDDPFDIDMSGLCLTASGPDFRQVKVLQVIESSPASEVKIVPGDAIVSIDGRPAREFTLSGIRERLMSPEHPVRLTIEREGRTWEVLLKLRRLI